MKQISIILAALAIWAAPVAQAQDAATEERLNKLSGQIEDLIAGQKAMRDQIDALSRELASVREDSGKPNASSASHEELSRLADAIKEVDRKRMEDNEKIHADLVKLGKTLSAPTPSHSRASYTPSSDTTGTGNASADKPGFEYVVLPGDTLGKIVKGCREKNVIVTTDQILKANPGLVAEKLKVGQKIFIPGPQS